MIERQIAGRGIDDPRLLEAFRVVPRENFIPPELHARAYDDGPLPIGSGQTISQPYIVALMIAAAGVGPDDHVLEVGAGSGYAAAILGHVAHDVVAVERIAALADEAAQRVAGLGLDNVRICAGDGSKGWPRDAPFDVIIVAAAGDSVPEPLLRQLRCPGGQLVMPVGPAGWTQAMVKIARLGDESYETTDLGAVRFVPLIADG